MKKVLLIAYQFPPSGDVGAQRTLKFAKYLPAFGWQPVVLTVSNGKFGNFAPALLDLVPEGTAVHRTRSFELLNEGRNSTKPQKRTFLRRVRNRLGRHFAYLTIPDNHVFWVFTATRKARALIRAEGIRHVYISGKPFSSFLVGALLKRTDDVRVAVDYRDPWTQNFNYYRRSPFHAWIEKKMETWVVRSSDVVITNTRVNEELMVSEFGGSERREKFITIHNGFDSEDFASVPLKRPDKFTITYAGGFYFSVGSDYKGGAGNWVMETHSPFFFFEALERLFERRPDMKPHFQVNFMGWLGHGYDPVIEKHGLKNVVSNLGYVDYVRHIPILKNSHALLLVLSRGEESKGVMPSKFFQYVGSGNPVLALVPEGEVRSIMDSMRAGVYVDPDDVEGISRAVEDLYDRYYRSSGSVERNEDEIRKYERKYLTGLLVKALEKA